MTTLESRSISQMYMLDSGARHTAHAVVCRIDNLLLLATGLFAGVGGARVKCVGRIILKIIKKCTNKRISK